MKWIQIAFLVIRMLWRYGPTLWKLGNDIYHDVENKLHPDGRPLTSDESASVFNNIAVTESIKRYNEIPTRPDLNKFREDVWKRNNLGKEPKKLTDPRLIVRNNRRVLGKKPT